MRTPHSLFLLLLCLAAGGCAPLGGEGGAGDDDDSTDIDEPQPCDSYGLEVGDCAPDFTLPAVVADTFTLSDTAGQRVVVLGTANW